MLPRRSSTEAQSRFDRDDLEYHGTIWASMESTGAEADLDRFAYEDLRRRTARKHFPGPPFLV
jgi:hypothetical protein